ncbi:hypothetical protein J2R98_000626 [Alkalibacillus filiformis]|uniref:DUF2515 domain-containing protein n=1 Tax=Alkalibacillus filiformis TaxID=200990 RepID=A0ABU0DQU7_9BACI|nr:DUF2515 family protein [Alkalibacillus filiformis]MDQ0350823.1 hypothetical protein [Alkalibacillus filiformis]
MIPLMVNYIKEQTYNHNINNVARTKAYLQFYQENPEIKWAFLASIVSRNAGWNMTDLDSEAYQSLLSEKQLKSLYLTYESINWYIFQDAYPQLLIYKMSKEQQKPLFFLFKYFHISSFMEREWYEFYQNSDLNRLMYSQIVNEQNIIQQPIIKHNPYRQTVFKSLPYRLQELLHLNAVLLPTEQGKVYGKFVPHFTHVSKRIKFGKKIAAILFYPYLYPLFRSFADNVPVTGERKEYEQFLNVQSPLTTKPLTDIYRNTEHEITVPQTDWSNYTKIKRKWWKEPRLKRVEPFADEFYEKRKQMTKISSLKDKLPPSPVEKE